MAGRPAAQKRPRALQRESKIEARVDAIHVIASIFLCDRDAVVDLNRDVAEGAPILEQGFKIGSSRCHRQLLEPFGVDRSHGRRGSSLPSTRGRKCVGSRHMRQNHGRPVPTEHRCVCRRGGDTAAARRSAAHGASPPRQTARAQPVYQFSFFSAEASKDLFFLLLCVCVCVCVLLIEQFSVKFPNANK